MIFPWDKEVFLRSLKHAIGIGVLGFVAIYIIWGEIVPADIFGLGMSVPLIAYLIHTVILINRQDKENRN